MQNEEEDLIRRLNRLTLEKTRIERRLFEINRQKTHEEEEQVQVLDRDGSQINLGDTFIFLKKEKFKAMIMIRRADQTRFGELKKSLDASTYLGRDEYPLNTTTAYDLLQSTSSAVDAQQSYGRTRGQRFRNRLTNVMFTQKGNTSSFDSSTATPGKDGKVHDVHCYNCGDEGHFENQCSKPDKRKKT